MGWSAERHGLVPWQVKNNLWDLNLSNIWERFRERFVNYMYHTYIYIKGFMRFYLYIILCVPVWLELDKHQRHVFGKANLEVVGTRNKSRILDFSTLGWGNEEVRLERELMSLEIYGIARVQWFWDFWLNGPTIILWYISILNSYYIQFFFDGLDLQLFPPLAAIYFLCRCYIFDSQGMIGRKLCQGENCTHATGFGICDRWDNMP